MTGSELLNDARRRQAAEIWSQIALGEHASIPAFARFVLELVALGAPARLLDRAAVAISDEIRHAKLAFGLAGEFMGHSVGPSSLDVSNSVTRQPEIADVCIATLTEGCIEEGIVAETARVAAQECSGPTREVWATIAVDESSHSELAWSCVEWFLSQAPEIAPAMYARLREVEASLPNRFVDEDRAGLLDYGILSRQREASIAVEFFNRKILPRALALIESTRASQVPS